MQSGCEPLIHAVELGAFLGDTLADLRNLPLHRRQMDGQCLA